MSLKVSPKLKFGCDVQIFMITVIGHPDIEKEGREFCEQRSYEYVASELGRVLQGHTYDQTEIFIHYRMKE